MNRSYQSVFITIITLLLISTHTLSAKENNASVAALAWSDMWKNIQQNYAYFDLKNIDVVCIEQQYSKRSKEITEKNTTLLFFERFLFEFTDGHMSLNTNNNDSYRLNPPISVLKNGGKFIIADYWQNQIIDDKKLSVGAELITINDKTPTQIIKDFPTHCLDKTTATNQQWIINKSLAGIYSQPRLAAFSKAGKTQTIDLDQLELKSHKSPMSLTQQDGIAMIKVHNSLGQAELINEFDEAIDDVIKQPDNNGLIIDLRNTISGGDSYIARGIISRLIKSEQAYQKHLYIEQRNGGPEVPRNWTEYVKPRGENYDKPIVLLVNRWTGSMGEGLTIGLHGMQRAHVIGSPMAGLLGAVYGFSLDGLSFGYQMPTEQLFHIDGTPREAFVPDEAVKPDHEQKDAAMKSAFEWLRKQ